MELIIFSRLTTKQADPLIFSRNADYQWVYCSQHESYKVMLGLLETLHLVESKMSLTL